MNWAESKDRGKREKPYQEGWSGVRDEGRRSGTFQTRIIAAKTGEGEFVLERSWAGQSSHREVLESLPQEFGSSLLNQGACKPMAVSFQCMTKYTTIKKNKIK